LEFARIAAARGHKVSLYEKEREVGGHVRLTSRLPDRQEYFNIARWLSSQARKNGAVIYTANAVSQTNLEQVLETEQPDHVVVATGSRVCVDGFQGWTAAPIPGWESAYCVGWDEIISGAAKPHGTVL